MRLFVNLFAHRLPLVLQGCHLTRYISPSAVPIQSYFSMTEFQVGSRAASPALPDLLAGPSRLSGRRLVFAILVTATMAAVMWLSAVALSADGLGALDIVLLALFVITLPWTVIGFWNAAIGFLILRFAKDPVAAVTPAVARIRGDEPITASVALLACIRNEDPARLIRNLAPMLDGLAPVGAQFHLYALSDTNDPAMAAIEQKCFEDLAAKWQGRVAITYRRRENNAGF